LVLFFGHAFFHCAYFGYKETSQTWAAYCLSSPADQGN